ncbi:hypothetical protein LTR94_037029, partial [Friedmanniomyces endolithicus]
DLGQADPDQWRTVPPAARAGLVRLPGRGAPGPVLERHAGAGDRPAGRAHHRRSHHDAILVRGHRPFAALERHHP